MGSGASTLFDVATELNLNHEQRQRFKAYYQELTLAGLNENRIREKLVTKFKNEKGTILTEDELKSTRKLQPLSRDEIFEANSVRILGSNTHSKDQLKSRGSIVVDSAEEKNLGLDEVPEENESMKLTCAVCKATFKSEALLDRHLRYSYLHAKTVSAKEDQRRAEDRAKRIAVMVHEGIQSVRRSILMRQQKADDNKARRRWFWAYDRVRTNIAIARTTEMLTAHYRAALEKTTFDKSKLIYDGSKLFWRLQLTIDLHMYLHDDESTRALCGGSPVIEVIGFDVSRQKELMRLYVNHNVLRAHLKERITEALVAAAQAASAGEDSSSAPPQQHYDLARLDKTDARIAERVIVEYLAAKLDIQQHPRAPTHRVLVLGSQGDDLTSRLQVKRRLSTVSENSSVTPSAASGAMVAVNSLAVPVGALLEEALVLRAVRPVEILRRRHTSDAERSTAFADFAKNRLELSSLTALAADHISGKALASARRGRGDESARLDEVTAQMRRLLKDSEATVPAGDVTGSAESLQGVVKDEVKEVASAADSRSGTRSLDGEVFKNYMRPKGGNTTSDKSFSGRISAAAPAVNAATSVVAPLPKQSPSSRSSLRQVPDSARVSARRDPVATPRSLADAALASVSQRRDPAATPRGFSDTLLTTPAQQREEAAALRELVRSAQSTPRDLYAATTAAASTYRRHSSAAQIAATAAASGRATFSIAEAPERAEEDDARPPVAAPDAISEKLIVDYFKKVDSARDLPGPVSGKKERGDQDTETSSRRRAKDGSFRLSAAGGSARVK